MRRKFIISLLLVSLVAFILLANYFYASTPIADEYVTSVVRRGDVEDVVTAYGSLQPLNYVDVGAQVSGILKKLYVDIGHKVEANQLLAEIDDTVYSARVDAGKANLINLEFQLAAKKSQEWLTQKQNQRSQGLYDDLAVSEEVAQTNLSNFKVAEAGVGSGDSAIDQAAASLRIDVANLSYTKILAPMRGEVVSLIARQGQTLNANQQTPPILRLADLEVMTVWAQVSEADIPRLQPGVTAYFTTLGNTQKKIYGKVRIIYPTPELISGAIFYDVLFDVNNHDRSLLPQMTAQVFFLLAEAKDVPLVPVLAIKEKKIGNQTVYEVQVVKDGQIEVREVVVGVKGRLMAEIRSGLELEETVIVGKKAANGPPAARARNPSMQPRL